MVKRCSYCGRYFTPDSRVKERQKACRNPECRKARKKEAQRLWYDKNPGYFQGRYPYVKAWREREGLCKTPEKVSGEKRRPLFSCNENTLYAHTEERESKGVDREKRRYPRKKISAPALVRGPDGVVDTGMLHDISLGGIRISFPPGFQCRVAKDCAISVVFTLPEGEKALSAECLPRHIHSNGRTTVGASFIDTDFQGFQNLQRYIMK
jgi:hypothetical protein